MTSQPYLICHIVRSEPAFDIAIRCDDMGTESDPGPWWIIPTSGHRAYPYRHWRLDDLYDGSDMDMPQPTYVLDSVEPPPNWPDHYQTYAAKGQAKIANLAEVLGFVPKPGVIRRR